MAQFLPFPKFRAFDEDGVPLAGGKLYSYAAGTSTLQATYTDQSGLVANANPVILDANGEASIWLGSNNYKLVLKDSTDTTLWTIDNLGYIADGSVTTVKLADGVLSADTAGRAKMANGFLSADSTGRAKMADGFFSADTAGRAKMANGFVNQALRAALGQQVSSSSGVWLSSFTTYTDITNLSVSITTTGRPVFIGMIPAGSGNASRIICSAGVSNQYGSANIKFVRGSTDIGQFQYEITTNDNGSAGGHGTGPWMIDVPSAGTYTYKAQGKKVSGDGVQFDHWKLIAFEL